MFSDYRNRPPPGPPPNMRPPPGGHPPGMRPPSGPPPGYHPPLGNLFGGTGSLFGNPNH